MWQLSSEYFVADAEAEWQTVLIPTFIAKYNPTARLFEFFGEQWRAVDVHLAKPANSLTQFEENSSFESKCQSPRIVVGILNIFQNFGRTFGERRECLAKLPKIDFVTFTNFKFVNVAK